MLTIALAALSLNVEVCDLEFSSSWGRPSVTATCEDQGAQDALNAVLETIRFPRGDLAFPPETIRVRRTGDGSRWRVPPRRLSMMPPQFPLRAVERGIFPARCAYGAGIGEDGRLTDIQVECWIARDRTARTLGWYRRAAMESLESAIIAATPGECYSNNFDFEMLDQSDDPDRPVVEYRIDEDQVELVDPDSLCPTPNE